MDVGDGDGKVSSTLMEGEEETNWIEISGDTLVKDNGDKKKATIKKKCPDSKYWISMVIKITWQREQY